MPAVPAPESVRRHFLSWHRPLLQQAVSFLTAGWNPAGPLDLSTCLIVVPTSQSGRRLREALARFASERGQAVFSPRVLTPNALLTLSPQPHVASRLESLLAWSEVFRELALEEFREVFPIDPPGRNLTWSIRLARDFTRLQRTLAETGLQLKDVGNLAGEDFSEVGRWEKIGELDELYREKLEIRGLIPESTANRNFVADPVLPAGITRIVLIGTPDPLPISLRILARFAAQMAVEVVVFAPADEAENFDGWGRPVAGVWTKRNLELPEFERHVKLCGDPAGQVNRIVSLAREYGDPLGILGVGVANPEALPLLETGLRHEDFKTFNPEGRSRRGDQLYQLIKALADFAREDEFSVIETLARCPDILGYLRQAVGETFSPSVFLASLDRLRARHLPPDLSEARRHLAGTRELGALLELRTLMLQGTFPERAAAVLTEIFGWRHLDLNRPADTAMAESAEAWAAVMKELTSAAERFDKIETDEWWEITLLLYGEAMRVGEKADGAIELLGWLELLWEDLPHLVVAGMNDGLVPDAIVGDPFLPESMREKLGLKTNADRLARDAYILQALVASRAEEGRLDLFLGKRSATGDPLRPSRLLLRCTDGELPRRVHFLFKEIESTTENPAWRRAWRLQPRRVASPESTSVTSLRRWLECPFRFYLERVLRMEAIDPAKVEMDAFDFGTLCHAAFEAMGRSPEWRDCKDPEKLRGFLLGQLELAAVKRYGTRQTLPLVIQLESARQRLSRVAEVQAQSRAEGWITEHVEHPFTLEINGLSVRGKIDRIDRHESTGEIRVLDYKTSDRFAWPREAHLRRLNSHDANTPEFARLMVGDDELVWKDLQLPLYLRALAAEFPGRLSCGYFNLPKAASETGIALWDDFTFELEESAWKCAEGVAGAIRAGKFWPPNEHISERSDAFASLFHHGVAESVAWEENTL